MAKSPMDRLSLDILEDQRLVRELLAEGFRESKYFMPRHAFDCAERALEVWHKDPPAAAIVDISLPGVNGVNAGVRLKRISASTIILLLSSHSYDQVIARLPQDVNTGWGYLLKNDVTTDRIEAALLDLLSGVPVDGPAGEALEVGALDVTSLTAQQRRVLRLIAAGKGNGTIAREMGITKKSVENYVNRIYSLLHLGADDAERNRRVIAALAATRLLDIEP